MYTGFPNVQDPGNKFKIPHDGNGSGIAWAKIDDLGEATASLIRLCYENRGRTEYANQTIMLSGPRSYNLNESVEILSQAYGKTIVIEEVDVAEYVIDTAVQEALKPYGEGDVPRKWATSFEAIKKGEATRTSGRLKDLLGRDPESFETTVNNMVQKVRGGKYM